MRAAARRQLWLFVPAPAVTDHTRDVVDAITLAVAEHFGADVVVVRSATRRQPYAQIRMVAMFVARKLTELRGEDIARVLRRDHSTVTHGVQTIEAALEVDPFLRRSVGACMEKATAVLARLRGQAATSTT